MPVKPPKAGTITDMEREARIREIEQAADYLRDKLAIERQAEISQIASVQYLMALWRDLEELQK